MLRWILRSFSFLTGVVPKRLSYAISTLVALGVYVFWREGRESALDNMRHVLGPGASEAEVHRTARRAMCNFFRVVVDFLRLPWMRENEIAHAVEHVRGEEHLTTMQDANRGVLIATLHFGNWDIAALVAISRGLAVHAIVDSYDDPGFDAAAQAQRTRRGIQVIPVGSMALRQVYRLLKDGEVVATAFDVPAALGNGGVPVQFFDGTIIAPAGPARLALRTGAAVATGVCVRQSNGTFMGWFNPPIEIESSGDEEHDVRVLTQVIAQECEAFIRQHPDQWYIFRRMWVDGSTPPDHR